jgi:hypothetical protein
MKHVSSLVDELKRNAAYYSAGADRDAGELLARAAEALSDIVKGRRPVPVGCDSDNCCCKGARIRSSISR